MQTPNISVKNNPGKLSGEKVAEQLAGVYTVLCKKTDQHPEIF